MKHISLLEKGKSKFLNTGFTLIEILVVVSIIGIITTVVLVSLNGAKDKATDVKSVTELDQLRKALELYRTDNGKYPGEENAEYNEFDNNKKEVCPAFNSIEIINEVVFNRCTSELGGKGEAVDLVPTPYVGSASTLFNTELVEKGYISAVPYYVSRLNYFSYYTGTQAAKELCGAQSFSSYLVTFENINYDLKMSKITNREGNCSVEDNNVCYYCFGY
jgi:prepilin-type N-terminal cleavage/methylation domain-containing protein